MAYITKLRNFCWDHGLKDPEISTIRSKGHDDVHFEFRTMIKVGNIGVASGPMFYDKTDAENATAEMVYSMLFEEKSARNNTTYKLGSYKNKLQEFCQQYQLETPVYDTKRCGGEDHCPQFSTNVRVGLMGVFGTTHGSKKEAENSAAAALWSTLIKEEKKKVRELRLLTHTYIYIDLENKPNISADILRLTKTINASFIGYASKGHPTLKKAREINDYRFTVKEISSNHSDAADFAIAIDIGAALVRGNYWFIVVSGDHFAETIASVAVNEYADRMCVACNSTESLLKELIELSAPNYESS
jgi:dsRNA-specific ribonuclease